MTKDTVYLKIDKNVQVHDAHVTLGDIARLTCRNRETENRLKNLKLSGIPCKRPGRCAMSALEVIREIQREMPELEVSNVGEADFIVTYEEKKQLGELRSWVKTAAVCVLAFFGAAFTIMTFNNDVDIPKLFGQLFFRFTGRLSDGFTVLEASYSVGVGLGILLYFNHFGSKKLTADPTPMEVEMRSYEDEINKTLIGAGNRKPPETEGF